MLLTDQRIPTSLNLFHITDILRKNNEIVNDIINDKMFFY